MIAKEFEEFLLSHLEHYLIPAEDLAILLILIILTMLCFY